MKLLKLAAVLAVLCTTASGARNRHVASEWNTDATCLEQNFAALSYTGGWYMSPWFNAYFQTPEWWIYHCEKGWLYPESDGSLGVWFYWAKHDTWVWTREDVYPLAYNTTSETWFNFCVK
jgi:hypothetical protein